MRYLVTMRDEAIAWAKRLVAGNTACEVRRVWE